MHYYADQNAVKRNQVTEYYGITEPASINSFVKELSEKELLWHGSRLGQVQLPPKMEARVIDAMHKDPTELKAIYKKNDWDALFDMLLGLGLAPRCTSWIGEVPSANEFDILFTEGGPANKPLFEAFESGMPLAKVVRFTKRPGETDNGSFEAFIPGWAASTKRQLSAYMMNEFYVTDMSKDIQDRVVAK